MKKQQRVIPGDIDIICDLHRLRVVLKEGNKNHLTLIQLQERYTRILLTLKKKKFVNLFGVVDEISNEIVKREFLEEHLKSGNDETLKPIR